MRIDLLRLWHVEGILSIAKGHKSVESPFPITKSPPATKRQKFGGLNGAAYSDSDKVR